MTDLLRAALAETARGLGIVRYDFGHADVAFGHADVAFGHADVAFGHDVGVPGFTAMVLRATAERRVVPYQNGLDAHDILASDSPFIAAALTA
jgi:hypothetical protein